MARWLWQLWCRAFPRCGDTLAGEPVLTCSRREGHSGWHAARESTIRWGDPMYVECNGQGCGAYVLRGHRFCLDCADERD